MSDALERIRELRGRALGEGLPTRRPDDRLYSLISDTYDLCLEVPVEELRGVPLPVIRGRTMSKPRLNADIFVVVSRLILTGVDNRNSIYRYASAMRAAHERQVPRGTLRQFLSENGGLHCLLRPPLAVGTPRSYGVLHLDQPVSFAEGGRIRLELRSIGGPYFEVIRCEYP